MDGSGRVVGSANTAEDRRHAALWTRDAAGTWTLHDIGASLGEDESVARAINARGEIVGHRITPPPAKSYLGVEWRPAPAGR